MSKQIPEKCRLCSKLTATQAQLLHGPQANNCWDSAVCPSRRSHARHRDPALFGQRRAPPANGGAPNAKGNAKSLTLR